MTMVTVPLTELKVRSEGKVTFIRSKEPASFQKLMAMGVLPGVKIALIQKFPSYVFQVHRSQFAVDKQLAACIYLKQKDL